MNDKVILKFKYNNIWYYVEKNNNLFRYYFFDNGKKNYSLNKEQLKVVNNVLNHIKPSKEYLKITKYKYNNIVYDIILDKKTNLYFFYPIPKKKDLIYLNYLFNNQNEYYNDLNKDLNKTNDSYFKRVIKVFGAKVVIFVECSLILAELVALGKVSETTTYNTYNHYYEVEKNSSISEEIISNRVKHAVKSNQNLNDKERDYLISFASNVANNKDCLNVDRIVERFKTIKFAYVQEQKLEDGVRIMGTYDEINNLITLYEARNINDSTEDIIKHEISHALTMNGSEEENTFLLETVNTIFNQDTNNIEENSLYNAYTNYTKALMEIIGVEPFRQYKGYANNNIIINSLCEIIDDRDKAITFLNLLDIYKSMYNVFLNDRENGELIENKKNLELSIYRIFEEYYNKKFDVDIEYDLLMQYYINFDNFEIVMDDMYAHQGNYLTFKAAKNYFKPDGTNNIICVGSYTPPSITINDPNYKTASTLEYFYINDENRFLPKDFALG